MISSEMHPLNVFGPNVVSAQFFPNVNVVSATQSAKIESA